MTSELARTFISWLLIFPAAFLTGTHLRRIIPFTNSIIQGIFFFASGLGILSYGVVVLSALGLLEAKWIWIFLLASILAGLKSFNSLVAWIKDLICSVLYTTSSNIRILKLIFVVSAAALLCGVFSPEIGGDSLTYHLNLPKVALMNGTIEPNYFDVNSYFPLFLNNLYLIGLATGGVISAKLFHFFSGLFIFFFLRSMISGETKNETLAWLFALIFWLTPASYNILSTTYNDVALGFFTFLALYALIQAFERQAKSLFFISGLLAGFGMALKYLGMVSCFGFFGVWVYQLVSNRSLRTLRHLPLWVSAFVLGCGYWLIKNFILTGNPVFPFFPSAFGTVPFGARYDEYGVGRGLFDFISVFWTMIQTPQAFGSYSSRIGVFYFFLLPFVIIGAVKQKAARPYAVFLLFFMIAWFFICQAHRYVIPALPALLISASIGISWSIENASEKMKWFLRRTGYILILGGLVVYLAAGIYRYRYEYRLITGRWSWSEFLVKMERTTAISEWINEALSPDAKILVESEPRQFYIGRAILRNSYLRYRTSYDQRDWNVEEFAQLLKQHAITHILESEQIGNPQTDPRNKALRELLGSAHAEKIHEVSSQNIRDERYVYRLYSLK